MSMNGHRPCMTQAMYEHEWADIVIHRHLYWGHLNRMTPLLDTWPEGPPDKNVGMVEALSKAWSWRMPPQKWMPSTTTTSHQPERH